MSEKLVIIGTGLFAEVAKAYFEEFTEYRVAAFACHEKYKEADSIYGLPLHTVETLQDSFPLEKYDLFIAIGYGKMNKMRQTVYEEVKGLGYTCATFIHPGVKIWDSTKLGENVFIFEDNTIQPFTSIGDNTILWSGNHFGHHGKIGNHCFITSHVVISGYCDIKDNVFIGVNATLRDGVTIAEESLIGAGAIIMKNTNRKEVFVPQATKVFPKNSEELKF